MRPALPTRVTKLMSRDSRSVNGRRFNSIAALFQARVREVHRGRPPTRQSFLSMDQVAARRERLVAFMRLLLAVSGLVVVWLHPSEPDRFVHATYLCLTLYCAYALAIYLASRGWLPHLPVDASH